MKRKTKNVQLGARPSFDFFGGAAALQLLWASRHWLTYSLSFNKFYVFARRFCNDSITTSQPQILVRLGKASSEAPCMLQLVNKEQLLSRSNSFSLAQKI